MGYTVLYILFGKHRRIDLLDALAQHFHLAGSRLSLGRIHTCKLLGAGLQRLIGSVQLLQ